MKISEIENKEKPNEAATISYYGKKTYILNQSLARKKCTANKIPNYTNMSGSVDGKSNIKWASK